MKTSSAGPVFDIPKLDNITVDGKADDWRDRGFRGSLVGVRDGSLISPDDFGVSFRCRGCRKGEKHAPDSARGV
jgi:hypothetical protein